MAFWNDIGTEPLRQYRWYMVFGGGANLDQFKFALKKCDRPKAKVNSIQHKYLNHFYNFPGRVEWEDVNVTFAAVEGGSKNLYNLLTGAGYIYPLNPDQMNTISKNGMVSQVAANGVELHQIGASGTTIETWRITNPLFTSLQFGALDYGSEEIVEITCVMKYDTATLT